MIDSNTAVAIGILLLIALIIVRVPIAFSLIVTATIGMLLLEGLSATTTVLSRTPYRTVANFSLVIIPMFVLIGTIAGNSRMASDAFDVGSRVFRRVRGGIAAASTLACAAFAAVSGSSVATVASVGRTASREMIRLGYPKRVAAGVVGAGGTLGVLIPPSVILVVYGLITGESIGQLLLAGIVPGILSVTVYCTYIFLRARHWLPSTPKPSDSSGPTDVPEVAHSAPVTGGSDESGVEISDTTRFPWTGLIGLAQIGLVFVIVLGGIYSGVFTATEASAVGALVAILIVLLDPRGGGLGTAVGRLRNSFTEAVSLSSMVFALVLGGALFTHFLVLGRVPQNFSSFVAGVELAPILVLIILLLAFIPLGMVLDSLSLLLIAVPVTYPAAMALGYDGIWFGILVVKMIELGLITPPLGLNAFVVAGVSKEITVEDAFAGVAPFAILDGLTVILLLAFPGLVLWLPGQLA